MFTVSKLSPFPVQVTADEGNQEINNIPATEIERLCTENKLLVFKGYSKLDSAGFASFCSSLGPLLQWEFGEILELRLVNNPANHIHSSGRVELHWDGAYIKNVSRFNVFQCLSSSDSGSGGETIFVDSESFINSLPQDEVEMLRNIVITYSTEKAAHYGGSVTVNLIDRHPYTGAETLRFIEPYNEDNMEVNPVNINVHGMSDEEQEIFLRKFIKKLYSSKYMYHHAWTSGDFVIADNHAVLHGRNKLKKNIDRHMQRVHVLDPDEKDCIVSFGK